MLDRLTGILNAPVLVATTQADGELSGCLVGFATQASIHPPRFLVGLSQTNHTFTVARRSDHLAVHVLSRRNLTLAKLFGGQTGDEINKFDHCRWHSGPEGMPILDEAPAWLVGKTVQRIDLGDHLGYLLEPVEAWFADDLDDLIHLCDVIEIEPGHEP